ncbi:hypothetical protein LCGC14_2691270 [marine sediment metagenome]|uniref:Uncharacterized protein n=1 Tax=marine sediment metagenome TaxID=412755 RepID=A0A0F9A5Y0_9ZZZZ
MREVMFATRCVACDEPIGGGDDIPVVAKGREYCPDCRSAISSAKSAEYVKQRATQQRITKSKKAAQKAAQKRAVEWDARVSHIPSILCKRCGLPFAERRRGRPSPYCSSCRPLARKLTEQARGRRALDSVAAGVVR